MSELPSSILSATAKMERCIKGSLFHVCVSCRAGWLLGKPHFLVYFTGAPVQIYHQGTVWRRVQMCGVCHGELGTEGQVQCVLWSFLLPSKSPSTGSLWVSSLVESHWHKLWWGLVPGQTLGQALWQPHKWLCRGPDLSGHHQVSSLEALISALGHK